MGKKLPPKEMELYRRTDEILHYLWDPCSVMGAPEARDEYYSYLPLVFEMVQNKSTEQEIANFLEEIQVNRMGLSKSPETFERLLRIAEILIRSRNWIFEGPP